MRPFARTRASNRLEWGEYVLGQGVRAGQSGLVASSTTGSGWGALASDASNLLARIGYGENGQSEIGNLKSSILPISWRDRLGESD